MFLFTSNSRNEKAKLDALDRSQAVIELTMDGMVKDANRNFLDAMGYRIEEVKGRPHSMFVDPGETGGAAYRQFWKQLRAGAYQSGVYRRIDKAGNEVWLNATYNPILGFDGRPCGVVKFASVVTEAKRRAADAEGRIAAIDRAQAVIEFSLDGMVQSANSNFLALMGYRLDEVVGKHHSMFLAPEEVKTSGYRMFWKRLAEGDFQSATFKRIRKDGREVWIQATYSVILDPNGQPWKVVKFATDVTERHERDADFGAQIKAINRSQAVIHFTPTGTILDANDNFLKALKYSREQVVGKNHSMFVFPEYRDTPEYQEFWRILRAGRFHSALYRRRASDGSEVWINASYNPVLSETGEVLKVVKYATDVTAMILSRLEAIRFSNETVQRVAAVTESVEALCESAVQISADIVTSRAAVDAIDQRTEEAGRATGQLNEAAASMDDVAKFIDVIASKIKLLALNATIEAARAGEAGRGFAVVATEVKSLAEQTSSATERIAIEIEAMQSVVRQVVGCLTGIAGLVDSVKQSVHGVTAAAEQQQGMTGGVVSGMRDARNGVEAINRNLEEMLTKAR